MAGIDWSRVVFTEHMTEVAVEVGACQVVFDFGADARVVYDVRVLRAVKGSGTAGGGHGGHFAVAVDASDPEAFRPVGEGTTPEDALQTCLENAGVHLRRQLRQTRTDRPGE
jgi:hypothetical protein